MLESPKNVAVVLLDSLNRHLLGCYGSSEFSTPNIDRFASQQAVRFTKYHETDNVHFPACHE